MKTPYEIKQELLLLDQLYIDAKDTIEEVEKMKKTMMDDIEQIKNTALANADKAKFDVIAKTRAELAEAHAIKMYELESEKKIAKQKALEYEKLKADINNQIKYEVSQIIGKKIKEIENMEQQLEQKTARYESRAEAASTQERTVKATIAKNIADHKALKAEHDAQLLALKAEIKKQKTELNNLVPEFKEGLGIVINKLDYIYKNAAPLSSGDFERERVKELADNLHQTFTEIKL
jgi:chromosome segregation ATPase